MTETNNTDNTAAPDQGGSWSSATHQPTIGIRRRGGGNRRARDPEAVPPEPPISVREDHLRRIAPYLFRLDLWAAQTVTEDFTREERLRNIEPHFAHLWRDPPPIALIESWIDSDELHHSHDVTNLRGFRDYVASLSHEQLLAVVANREASAYYIRLVLGRMWKLQEKNTIYRLAEQDLRGAFEINLGLLIGERPANETEYLTRLTQKQVIAQVRLARSLGEARLLRDQITKAYRLRAVDEEVLPLLRLRANCHGNGTSTVGCKPCID